MNNAQFISIKDHYAVIGKEFEDATNQAREDGGLPKELWPRLGAEGLFANSVHYQNNDGLHFLAAALEGLSYGLRDTAPGGSLISQAGAAMPIIDCFGSEPLKERYWQSIISGQIITAVAVTEFHGGSEARTIETSLSAANKGFVLNGCKWSITNAPIAQLILVAAYLPKEQRPVFVLVDSSWSGVDQSHKARVAGAENSPVGELIFKDVFIPDEFVLGSKGDAFKILNMVFVRERLLLGFLYAGILERIIEEVLEYSDDRVVFGKRIIEFEYIRKRLTDIQCNYEVAKRLADHALELFMNDKDYAMHASISKFHGANLTTDALINAMKIFASYGVQKGKFDHLLLTSIACSIGGGTEEMQREEIINQMYRAYRSRKRSKRPE